MKEQERGKKWEEAYIKRERGEKRKERRGGMGRRPKNENKLSLIGRTEGTLGGH